MGKSVLYRKAILSTIKLAHFFKSAFTAEQAHRYLRLKVDRAVFDRELQTLIADGTVEEKNGALFVADLKSSYEQKKRWSRDLFKSHRSYLWMVSKTPWLKYLALTGANAFESCRHEDDIDLFLVSKRNRLWLCYLWLVVFSKLSRKRHVLCINYIVDEENLHIPQHNYYTAVQIMQMVPVFENGFSQKMIRQNMWVFDYLPNAEPVLPEDDFYVLRKGVLSSNGQKGSALFSRLNQYVYKRYAGRLERKYPDEIGKGIILDEGRAKLNRIDHSKIYDEIYQETDATITL